MNTYTPEESITNVKHVFVKLALALLMWYIDEEWYIKKVKFESNLSISRNLLSIDTEQHARKT